VALTQSVIGALYFLLSALVAAAIVGWGVSLVWNKFATAVDKAAPKIGFIDGFALYLIVSLLAGIPRLLGAGTTTTELFGLAYTLFLTAVGAAIVGWGVELLYNKFLAPRFPSLPAISWIDGFAAFWVLSLIAGAPILFG
jgi:hypothetical protein